ncbi:LOW QUALITY PROTEIN: CMRF35-like molecule 6, partial [Sylvia atricapilla]|uniref:LOW QUALITY PROTEIN: CMRF35-like molecule 6 n=1 Tax=Sylvia atricapilla TaxID=48155 RepID=UPI0033926037
MRLLPLLAWALLPGCGAVTGPGTVREFLGASLSLTCTYDRGQEKLPKFWCTLKSFPSIGTCKHDIVITSESESEARRGRFSIRDNRAQRVFTVTVDALSKEDQGTFYCGVRTRIFQRDDSVAVKVIVASAPVIGTLGSRGQAAGGAFTVCVTGPRCPSGPRGIHPSSAAAAPPLWPDAPQDSGSEHFPLFPALAGLRPPALLSVSGAVLWVSPRDPTVPAGAAGAR